MDTLTATSVSHGGTTSLVQPFLSIVKDYEVSEKVASQQTKKKQSAGRNDHGGVGEGEGSECSMDYLAELLREKKLLNVFPQVFHNIERLVDDEVERVRTFLFGHRFSFEAFVLPEPKGEKITVQEKILIPHKEFPDYNFVGRILGPRGMTAKQLEKETGCKIMVRGRGSLRDRVKEEMNRGKPNWEHLEEDLHVLVQCEDTPNRVYIELKAAVSEIKRLLIPAPETDELKRKQLMELAIFNGTYRPSCKYALQMPRLLTPMTLMPPSGMTSQPLFLSPVNSPLVNGNNITGTPAISNYMHSPSIDYNLLFNQMPFDSPLAPYGGDSRSQLSLVNNTVGTPTSSMPHCFFGSASMTPPLSGFNIQ